MSGIIIFLNFLQNFWSVGVIINTITNVLGSPEWHGKLILTKTGNKWPRNYLTNVNVFYPLVFIGITLKRSQWQAQNDMTRCLRESGLS